MSENTTNVETTVTPSVSTDEKKTRASLPRILREYRERFVSFMKNETVTRLTADERNIIENQLQALSNIPAQFQTDVISNLTKSLQNKLARDERASQPYNQDEEKIAIGEATMAYWKTLEESKSDDMDSASEAEPAE